jgi:hypothetical protein
MGCGRPKCQCRQWPRSGAHCRRAHGHQNSRKQALSQIRLVIFRLVERVDESFKQGADFAVLEVRAEGEQLGRVDDLGLLWQRLLVERVLLGAFGLL